MISPFIAAFTGTAVEFFETAVIAYAIVRAGYPREALAAVVIGHVLVAVLAITLLPLNQMLPVFWLRVLAAFLLTAMGLHWTQKSIRRLIANKRPRWAEDPLGKLKVSPTVEAAVQAFSPFVFLVMAKSSVVEAAEIVVVVLPIGAATAAWNQVLWGVAAGISAVTAAALVLHGRMKSVPEVKLKLAIGLVLLALGLSWCVEIYQDYPGQLEG
ncbi:MAG: hypothetical protein CL581_08295 [Alteromonadaceae bacterium]|nr:hypothetical protein [Alteromonadaceae bacterium]MBH87048.1 hypothetical protein [Alteromonadaceae bacterium]|tara:strand:- start:8101 stop:8739 length:639 start_codon:yes stop_codon:yes gene_type:complete